jgi:flavin reductase (DIM6/NTAB) family NADH-FMN oxidoreductase RutF
MPDHATQIGVPKLRVVGDATDGVTSPTEFAEAMSALASGVVVVTCLVDGRPWGATVTAFASVSADPPTVLVSLGSSARAAEAIRASGRFGASILGDDLLPVALYASAPGRSKFLGPLVEAGTASPAVAHALAHLDCDVSGSLDVADHTVFLGRVRAARAAHAGAPLVYHRREYRTLAEIERSRSWVSS